MNKKVLFILIFSALILTGCGRNVVSDNDSSKANTTPTPIVTTIPDSEGSSVEETNSGKYTLDYNKDKFDYRNTQGGSDEYIHKNSDQDFPVFVSVAFIDKDRVRNVKNTALGLTPEQTSIGKNSIAADYATKDVDGGTNKTYFVTLSDGNGYIIETQWFDDEQKQDVDQLINSFDVE